MHNAWLIIVQEKGLTFPQALEVVKGSSLYTVHTPCLPVMIVLTKDYFKNNMYAVPDKLGITWVILLVWEEKILKIKEKNSA
jgi:glucan phosphorylase